MRDAIETGRCLRQALAGGGAALRAEQPLDRLDGGAAPGSLYLLAGNVRFLLLEPPRRWTGLASRVLGLSLRHLPGDWRVRHRSPH